MSQDRRSPWIKPRFTVDSPSKNVKTAWISVPSVAWTDAFPRHSDWMAGWGGHHQGCRLEALHIAMHMSWVLETNYISRSTTFPSNQAINAIFKSNSVHSSSFHIISYHFISFDIISYHLISWYLIHPNFFPSQILPQLEPLLSHEFQARTTELHQLLGSNDSPPGPPHETSWHPCHRVGIVCREKMSCRYFLKCHCNIVW